jgi:hypothetical protein
VYVVVLHKVLVLLLLRPTVHYLASCNVIMLRVHGPADYGVCAVLAAENGVLLLNDKVLHVSIVALWDSHRNRFLGVHLHESVV